MSNTFDLNSLNGENGLVFTSNNGNDNFGYSAAAGDFNCDGQGDFAIGAPNNPGAVYIFWGGQSFYPSTLSAQQLNQTTGAIIYGVTSSDKFGTSLSNAGDVNADGCDDLIAGAPNASPMGATNMGQAYVIYGSSNFTTPMSVGELDGKNGFTINGVKPQDTFGSSVSGMRGGDVNGDKIADIIIGAPGANEKAGVAYLIYGAKNIPTSINAKSLNGTNGALFESTTFNDLAGTSVSIGGDYNADGLKDILIGAPGANNNLGQATLLYGQKAFPAITKISNIGNSGMLIKGDDQNGAQLGTFAGGVGDINNDGINDFTVSTHHNCCGGYFSNAFTIYGSKNGYPQSISYQQSDNGLSLPGFIFQAEGEGNNWYGPVIYSIAGDLNQDGISDMILSSQNFGGGSQSLAVVIFGNTTRFNNPVNYADPDQLGGNGLMFTTGNDFSNNNVDIGFSIAGNIDFNNDQISDIILGTQENRAYVVFGSPFFGAQLSGDVAAPETV